MTSPCKTAPHEAWARLVQHWLSPDETSNYAVAEAAVVRSVHEPVSHAHVLVPERLRSAGLDIGYELAVEPEKVAVLMTVCRSCTHTRRCTDDFAAENSNERVAAYCPNTPEIDALIVQRSTGKVL